VFARAGGGRGEAAASSAGSGGRFLPPDVRDTNR